MRPGRRAGQLRRATRDERVYAGLGLWNLPARIILRGVVVVAHPDDEVIGVGARLPRWADVHLVYVTDGAPRDMRDASLLGLTAREAYAALRRAERDRALGVAGAGILCTTDLGHVDQEASRDLVRISRELLELFRALTPDVVVTHPYEGGHPDHDATAFAVHAAVRQLRADGAAPLIMEMASYHRGDRGIETGCFLSCADRATYRTPLDATSRAVKQRMLACHRSQREVLRQFRCDAEPIRIAPEYDFTVPPHSGPLFYEHFPWGISGEEWRARARMAWRELAQHGRRGRLA